MSKKNKVKFGLKNTHYAPISEGADGTITFAKPVPLPGSVNISLTPKGETTPFNADDIVYAQFTSNNGYEGNLELAMVTDEFRVDILGDTKDDNGMITENANVQSIPFALLFEFTGDVNAVRHVTYYNKATRPNIEGGTKGEGIEVKTDTFDLSVLPLPDGRVKTKTSAESDPTAYANWYNSVYEGLQSLGNLEIISAAGTTSGKTAVIVTPELSAERSYKYKTGMSVQLPSHDQACNTGYTSWDGTVEIAATTGQKILVVEVDGSNKAKKAGIATIASKE